MAIQKRFIHFKKFSDFNSKKLSANEANTQYTVGVSGAIQDGDPDILYQSYVWIKDTQQQWTHGRLYNGNDTPIVKGEADNSAVLKGGNNQATNVNEVALGKYNESNNDTMFSIGIGTSDTDRKNAFEVKQNGDIYIEGVEGRIQDKLNESGATSSNHIKHFTTELEYNTAKDNGELEYPCVVYIEESDKTLFLTGGSSYNAIIEYNELIAMILGESVTTAGFLPVAMNPQYFEYFMVDGVDILPTNVVSLEENDAIALYDVNIGDSFEVNFKFKDVIEITYDNEQAMVALYMSCSYLEVDESFYNKISIDGDNMPIGLYLPTVGPNFTCKFIGDFMVDPAITMSVISGLLYGPLAFGPMVPDTQFSIVLQIPDGNATYGNPTDKWSQDDETATFYGICNAILELYNNPENVSLTIETY